MNIIVDTDALLGLFNAADLLHHRAALVAEKLTEERVNIFLLPTTLAEFALLASSRVGVQQTTFSPLMAVTLKMVSLLLLVCSIPKILRFYRNY